MTRLLSFTLAVSLIAATAASAQEQQPEPQPQRPRPGAILEGPGTGRITEAPAQAVPPEGLQQVERFEAVGNITVASDTIRVYLGIVPGEPYNPEAIQRNFLNLWQTGLFDDIRIETEQGDTGVIVRAIVKERPRIGAVEFRGNKELTAGIRPEHFEIVDGTPPGPGATVRATTDVVEFLGNEELLHVRVGEHDLVAIVGASHRVRPGDLLDLWVPLEKIHLFDIEEGHALALA